MEEKINNVYKSWTKQQGQVVSVECTLQLVLK